jgi:serine/threonine protein kinase
VLYECLAGAPPFRRETEAETLWAHIQQQPPSLRAQPALGPLLRRALAKDQNERPTSCTELIDAAAAALGIGAHEHGRYEQQSGAADGDGCSRRGAGGNIDERGRRSALPP